ncbi:MAG: hypothetical protein V3T72_12370, partial [Thermoanaerobaculia bacterium]
MGRHFRSPGRCFGGAGRWYPKCGGAAGGSAAGREKLPPQEVPCMIHLEPRDTVAVLRMEHGKANAADSEL